MIAVGAGLTLIDVRKSFDAFELGPISCEFARGRAYGLLGPNGAGKTTLLNLVTLQSRLSGGSIAFDGVPVRWGDTAWKSRLSYIREVPAFYDELTVGATLDLARSLYGQWDRRHAAELVQRFSLDVSRRVGALSKGTKVKLGLVVALAHRAELLVLDEPSAGLDPDAREDLQRALRDLMAERRNICLILSSHIFEDIEAVADEILILRGGRFVWRGPRNTGVDVAAVYRRTAP